MPALTSVKEYWMVHCLEGHAPNMMHPSRAAAMLGAQRLAASAPGKTFVVLRSIEAYQVAQPVRSIPIVSGAKNSDKGATTPNPTSCADIDYRVKEEFIPPMPVWVKKKDGGIQIYLSYPNDDASWYIRHGYNKITIQQVEE